MVTSASAVLQEVMNSALSSHSESIPKFIHNASKTTTLLHQPLTHNPHHPPLLLRFLLRLLFFSMPHIFGEEPDRLDHHRVITFENLFYKAVICEAILNFAICEREDRSSLIRKHSTTAFFQQDDISLRVRWKKQRGIDLIDRLSE